MMSSSISTCTPSTRCSTARAASTSCSIEAAELKMPALAVTEHGNMFSSVVFHDRRGSGASSRSSGCEVYVAPGSRTDRRAGTPGETANHLVLLAETQRGLPQPDQAGLGRLHRRASTTSRASTRSCSRSTRAGLIGLSSCLKGEVATRLRDAIRRARRSRRPAAYRDILGPDNFFLEMQYQGIDEQRIVNTRAAADRARARPAARLHERRALPAAGAITQPHDVLLCIGTGKTRQRRRSGCATTATSSS